MESIVGGARLESLGHEALLQPQPVSSFYTSTGPDCRVRGTLCSNCVLCKLTYTNAIRHRARLCRGSDRWARWWCLWFICGDRCSALSRARHERVPHLDSVALECGFNGSESIVNVEHTLFTMKKGRTSA